MNMITLSLKFSGFIFLLCEKGAGEVMVLCRVFGKIKTYTCLCLYIMCVHESMKEKEALDDLKV